MDERLVWVPIFGPIIDMLGQEEPEIKKWHEQGDGLFILSIIYHAFWYIVLLEGYKYAY